MDFHGKNWNWRNILFTPFGWFLGIRMLLLKIKEYYNFYCLQIVPEFLLKSPYFQNIISLAGFRKCLGTRFRKRLISSQRKSINQSTNRINDFWFSYKPDFLNWLMINVNRYLLTLFFESWTWNKTGARRYSESF